MLVFYVMTVAQHSLLTWLPHLSASIPLEESAFSPSLGLRSFQPAAFSSSLLVTTPFISLTCGLFISLCALFRTPILCFQSLAHSFAKTPGVGTLVPLNILCPSAAIRFLRALCFHTLTNCFSGKSFRLTTIQIAQGWHPNQARPG